jgi:hypothetical protein
LELLLKEFAIVNMNPYDAFGGSGGGVRQHKSAWVERTWHEIESFQASLEFHKPQIWCIYSAICALE